VKRQTAAPDRENIEGILVFAASVDEHVEKSRADQHPDHEVPDEIIKVCPSEPGAATLDLSEHETVAHDVSN
jgi:hypothetical protein